MKYLLSVFTGLVFSLSLYAGNGQEGHGGRVYFCKDSNGAESSELLDYYFARTRWGLDVKMVTGDNEIAVVTKILENVKRIDPSRSQVYLNRAKGFLNRATMLDESGFGAVDDLKATIGSRENCDLKLIVKQNISSTPFAPEEKKFLISRPLWEKLDVTTRAGIILHEIILEDSSLLGNTIADGPMYVNALYTSTKFESLDIEEYFQKMVKSGFKGVYQGNFLLSLDKIKFHEGDVMQVSQGIILDIKSDFQELNRTSIHDRHIKGAGIATFTKSGTLATLQTAKGAVVAGNPEGMFGNLILDEAEHPIAATTHMDIKVTEPNYSLIIPGNSKIIFSKNGSVNGMNPTLDLSFSQSGVEFMHLRSHWVHFNSTGIISRAFIDETDIESSAGKIKACADTYFDETGKVIASTLCKRKMILAADGKKKNLKAGSPVLLKDGIREIPNGIINLADQSGKFIKIVNVKKNVGFKLCEITNPEKCTQIGKKEFYTRKELRKNLNLSLNVDTRAGILTALGIGTGAATGGSVAVWALAGYVVKYGATAPFLVAVGIIPSLAVGAMAGIVVAGVFYGVEELANLPYFQKRRAVNRIIKRHYLGVNENITSIAQELETSLGSVIP